MAVKGLGLSRISETQFQVEPGDCDASIGAGTLQLAATTVVVAQDALPTGDLQPETAYAVWLSSADGTTAIVLSEDFANLDATTACRVGTVWTDADGKLWPFTQKLSTSGERRAYTFQGPEGPRLLLEHGTKTVWTPLGRIFFLSRSNRAWKKMRCALSVTGGTGPTADYRAMNGSGEVHVIEPLHSTFSLGTQADIFEYKSSGTGSTGATLMGLEERV